MSNNILINDIFFKKYMNYIPSKSFQKRYEGIIEKLNLKIVIVFSNNTSLKLIPLNHHYIPNINKLKIAFKSFPIQTLRINRCNINLLIVDIKGLVDVKFSNNGINNFSIVNSFDTLYKLDCSNNNLMNLFLNKFNKLKYLNCSNNKISKIYGKKWVNLKEFDCSNNLIDCMDISNSNNLEVFKCINNKSIINVPMYMNFLRDIIIDDKVKINRTDIDNIHTFLCHYTDWYYNGFDFFKFYDDHIQLINDCICLK